MYNKISNPNDYKVGLYIRLSKEDNFESESQSVKNQRSMLQGFVSQNGLSLFDEYVDDGFSGTSFDRPGFNRMLCDIKENKINMVITKDLSRLGRDYIQTGFYMEQFFPEQRVRYISLLDGIDTGVDSSINDITPFKAIMNDMYAKDISKKIKSVKHDKQQKGLFIGGKAPYGYKLSEEKKNTLVVDNQVKEVVQEIFKLALNGISCRQIAMNLNENNILAPSVYSNINLSKKGPYFGKWSAERINFMLKNQVYIGDMVQGRVKKINYKSKKVLNLPPEEWIIVENTHEGIIDKKNFEKVQLIINSRKKTRTKTYEYLLKGIIFCHECGYPLGIIKRTLAGNKEAFYFICRTYQRFTKLKKCTCHNIREEIVNEAIIQKTSEICAQYMCKEEISKIVDNIYESNKEISIEDEIKNAENKIKLLTTNFDKIYIDKISGILEETDFKRLGLKIKENINLLKLNLKELNLKKNQEIVAEKIETNKLIECFLKEIKYNRELIVSLIEKIELTENKEIFIYFRCKEPKF